ncbi:MAG: hypothetical protein BWY06_03099 [Candidatus Latescibacteria bacterium ADurb.Bin168]|nr:MAG: hypothetical protein BWY06_03099 [Candidatus Latescibacteria bacterium ADurb.Bin168]
MRAGMFMLGIEAVPLSRAPAKSGPVENDDMKNAEFASSTPKSSLSEGVISTSNTRFFGSRMAYRRVSRAAFHV